jgi:ribosomal protein L21
MSYAIIETGGKQVRVEPGRFYDIELLPVEPEGKHHNRKRLVRSARRRSDNWSTLC